MTTNFSADFARMTVGDLLKRWPQTVRVFLDYKMNCPACPIAPFMTVDEAAGEYGIDAARLKRDIARAVAGTECVQ